MGTAEQGIRPTFIHPGGDLSRTGDAALLAVAAHWRLQARGSSPIDEVRRAKEAELVALGEAARRRVPSAAASLVVALARAGRIADVVDAVEAERARSGSVLLDEAVGALRDDPSREVLLRWARRRGLADVRRQLGEIVARRDEPLHDRSSLDDLTAGAAAHREALLGARVEGDAEAAFGAAVDLVRYLASMTGAAQRSGRLDLAEEWATEAMELVTVGPEADQFGAERRGVRARSVSRWRTVLTERHGDDRAKAVLQRRIEGGNGALLVQDAADRLVEVVMAIGDGAPPRAVAREAAEATISIAGARARGVAGADEAWLSALGRLVQDGNEAAWEALRPEGSDRSQEWLSEEIARAAADMVRRGAAPSVLLEASELVERASLAVAWRLASAASLEGVEGADRRLVLLRRASVASRLRALPPNEVAGRCQQEAALHAALDPVQAAHVYEVGMQLLAGSDAVAAQGLGDEAWRMVVDRAIAGDRSALEAAALHVTHLRRLRAGGIVLDARPLDPALLALAQHAGRSKAHAASVIEILDGYAELLAHRPSAVRRDEPSAGGSDRGRALADVRSALGTAYRSALALVPDDRGFLVKALQHVRAEGDHRAAETFVRGAMAAMGSRGGSAREGQEAALQLQLARSLWAQGRVAEAEELLAAGGEDLSNTWAELLAAAGTQIPVPLPIDRWGSPEVGARGAVGGPGGAGRAAAGPGVPPGGAARPRARRRASDLPDGGGPAVQAGEGASPGTTEGQPGAGGEAKPPRARRPDRSTWRQRPDRGTGTGL